MEGCCVPALEPTPAGLKGDRHADSGRYRHSPTDGLAGTARQVALFPPALHGWAADHPSITSGGHPLHFVLKEPHPRSSMLSKSYQTDFRSEFSFHFRAQKGTHFQKQKGDKNLIVQLREPTLSLL